MESVRDLLRPSFSEKNHWVSRGRADLSSDFFKRILKISSDTTLEEERKIEVEVSLTLDELLGTVGHEGLDVGILLLFVDGDTGFASEGTKINNHSA